MAGVQHAQALASQGNQFGDRAGRSVAVPPTCDATSPHQRRELAGELHDGRSMLVLLDTRGYGLISDAERRGGLDQQPCELGHCRQSRHWTARFERRHLSVMARMGTGPARCRPPFAQPAMYPPGAA